MEYKPGTAATLNVDIPRLGLKKGQEVSVGAQKAATVYEVSAVVDRSPVFVMVEADWLLPRQPEPPSMISAMPPMPPMPVSGWPEVEAMQRDSGGTCPICKAPGYRHFAYCNWQGGPGPKEEEEAPEWNPGVLPETSMLFRKERRISDEEYQELLEGANTPYYGESAGCPGPFPEGQKGGVDDDREATLALQHARTLTHRWQFVDDFHGNQIINCMYCGAIKKGG